MEHDRQSPQRRNHPPGLASWGCTARAGCCPRDSRDGGGRRRSGCSCCQVQSANKTYLDCYAGRMQMLRATRVVRFIAIVEQRINVATATIAVVVMLLVLMLLLVMLLWTAGSAARSTAIAVGCGINCCSSCCRCVTIAVVIAVAAAVVGIAAVTAAAVAVVVVRLLTSSCRTGVRVQ